MRYLPSWTSTWSRWKQTVPRWSTCAASSLQSTSRWPPPASVDADPARVGKGEGTEPRRAGRGKLDGMRPGNKVRLCMPTTHEDASSHPALFECMFFCTIPVIGFTCSFQTWGWVGAGGRAKCAFLPWSGPVFPCDSSSRTRRSEAILQPQMWGSCWKSSLLPQRWEPAPTAEAMGSIDPPHDMCHQPWSRRVWRQASDSLLRGRRDEGRMSPVAAPWGSSDGCRGALVGWSWMAACPRLGLASCSLPSRWLL